MGLKKQERVRIAAAWLCLLAVALLYAPLAGAAWLSRSMDCCAGGFCPMAAHHHQRQQSVPARDSSPMNCGHDMGSMSGMASCSISCCQNSARPALIPAVFLLPAVSLSPAAAEVVRPIELASSLELSRFVQPLFPPPRFAAQVL